MADMIWELSESDTVRLKTRLFRRPMIFRNDAEIGVLDLKHGMNVPLSDGRTPSLKFIRSFFDSRFELRLDGTLKPPTVKGVAFACDACRSEGKGYEQFCASCGKPMPSGESMLRRITLRRSADSIAGIGVVFLLGGLVLALANRASAVEALQNIAAYPAELEWSVPVAGKTVTVGELRSMLETEWVGILGVNLFLATVMFGIHRWGKKSPTPAIFTASAIWFATIVLNGILEPTSLAQGIWLKIFVTLLFVRGIRAGVAERAATT